MPEEILREVRRCNALLRRRITEQYAVLLDNDSRKEIVGLEENGATFARVNLNRHPLASYVRVVKNRRQKEVEISTFGKVLAIDFDKLQDSMQRQGYTLIESPVPSQWPREKHYLVKRNRAIAGRLIISTPKALPFFKLWARHDKAAPLIRTVFAVQAPVLRLPKHSS